MKYSRGEHPNSKPNLLLGRLKGLKNLKGDKNPNWNGGKLQRSCLTCKRDFFIFPSLLNYDKHIYCSRLCFSKARHGKPAWNKGGKNPALSLRNKTNPPMRNPTSRQKASETRKRLIKEGKVKAFGQGLEAAQKNPWNKGKTFLAGEKNPRWQGGHQNWRGTDWKKQREKALERDNWTCVKCGEQEKQKLVVDHVIPWHISKDNSVENLQAMCWVCHPQKDWAFFKEWKNG